MSLTFEIELKGAEEIQRKLDKGRLLSKPLKHLLAQAAYAIERRAKIFSPVDTGRLRASWTTEIDISPMPIWAKVGTIVEYAEPLEYSGKSPQGVGRIPFFQPAISESQGDIDKAVEEAQKMIENYWGT